MSHLRHGIETLRALTFARQYANTQQIKEKLIFYVALLSSVMAKNDTHLFRTLHHALTEKNALWRRVGEDLLYVLFCPKAAVVMNYPNVSMH